MGDASGTVNGLEIKIISTIDSEAFKTTILIHYINLFYFTKFFSCCENMKKGVVNAMSQGMVYT